MMQFRKILRWFGRGIALLAVVVVCVATIILLVRTPSHDRDWEVGQEKLPRIVFDKDAFTIENLRDFTWTGPFEAKQNYITDAYKVSDIQGVDVVISHFAEFEGLAHIFLSFAFVDGRHVSISVESRREKGEKFSPFWGLLDQYEMIYVVATDRDIIGLRTGHRNERVYIYPTKASKEKAQELFKRLAANINAIHAEPVMYNTLMHNCTNEVSREVEAMSTIDFPITYKTILPGFFDEVLYSVGVIDTSEPFEELRRASLVNNALVDEEDEDFAVHVRQMVGK
jgi:hypothetical protein